MKSFATIVEIDIGSPDYKGFFYPHKGVWILPLNETKFDIKTSFFTETYETQIEKGSLESLVNINSLRVDNDRFYTKVSSFDTLMKEERSFYVFTENNIEKIAIHFENFSTPFSKKIILMNSNFILCDRVWEHKDKTISSFCAKYFADVKILEVPTLDLEGDSLTFETVRIDECSVRIANTDGMFDNFENIYGNRLTVKKVFDGEDYEDAKQIFAGFVQKPEYVFLDEIVITAMDIRASYSTELPKRFFNLDDYPFIDKFPTNVKEGTEVLGRARNVCYGRGVVVQLVPIKYETRVGFTPEIVFEICDTTHNAIERIAEKADMLDKGKIKPHLWFIEKAENEKETEDGETKTSALEGDLEIFVPEFKDFNDGNGEQRVWTLDKEKGTITFSGHLPVHSITDDKDNIYELFVEVDVPPYKSLSVMRDMLVNYEKISFIDENFDIENWTKDEAESKEVCMLIDDENKERVIDIIGKLCYLERGRLVFQDNRVAYKSTKNRKVKAALKHFDTGRIDTSINSDEYISSIEVEYDMKRKKLQNYDFEERARKRHVIANHESVETLHKNEADVSEFTNLTLEDRHTMKDYFEFEYFKELPCELYDYVVFYAMRGDNRYFVKPCVCEILKLNVYDEIVKLRKVSGDIEKYLPHGITDFRELYV